MNDELEKLVEEAQPDVSQRKLARIYAEALLNAAEKNDAAAEILGELHQLLDDLRRRDPYVRAFFTSGVIGKERREAALKAAFGGRAHPVLMNFLASSSRHPLSHAVLGLAPVIRNKCSISCNSLVPVFTFRNRIRCRWPLPSSDSISVHGVRVIFGHDSMRAIK